MILETRIRYALDSTRSISEAARYLNKSRKTIYKYMNLYNIPYADYSNKSGMGIKKGRIASRYKLDDILDGKHNGIKFDKTKLIIRFIKHLRFEEKCDLCGFDEKRIVDQKVPLLIDHIDDDRTNWVRENIRLLCYNCYYLNVGNIYGQKHTMTALIDPLSGDVIEKITL